MPEKKRPMHVLKMRMVGPPNKPRKIISLPTTWPKFHYEYDSPVMWMFKGPRPSSLPPSAVLDLWGTLDISFANRGATDQLFSIFTTFFSYSPTQEYWTDMVNPVTISPGQISMVNGQIGIPDDGVGLWLQMFVTSRDVIPSLHLMVPGTTPPHNRDLGFYFSPGDFAFFDVPAGIVPPGFGETNKP